MTRDVLDTLARDVEQSVLEAVSVLVLTNNERVARLVAPMVARRLYPSRSFGSTLSCEWVNDGLNVGFACDVSVVSKIVSAAS